jgi:hypothetical protein
VRSVTRELVYDQPLMVKFPPDLKRRLKIEAARRGTDMSKITRIAVEEYLDRTGPGSQLVERLRGRATRRLSTDEIMRLTRD